MPLPAADVAAEHHHPAEPARTGAGHHRGPLRPWQRRAIQQKFADTQSKAEFGNAGGQIQPVSLGAAAVSAHLSEPQRKGTQAHQQAEHGNGQGTHHFGVVHRLVGTRHLPLGAEGGGSQARTPAGIRANIDAQKVFLAQQLAGDIDVARRPGEILGVRRMQVPHALDQGIVQPDLIGAADLRDEKCDGPSGQPWH